MLRIPALLSAIRFPSPLEIVGELWFCAKTQGLWWAISVILHAVILSAVLLFMGNVAPPKIEDKAPAFDTEITTVAGNPDIEHFALGDATIDAADLSSDLSTPADGSSETIDTTLSHSTETGDALNPGGGNATSGETTSVAGMGGISSGLFGPGARARRGGGVGLSVGTGLGASAGGGIGNGNGIPRRRAVDGVRAANGVGGAAEGVTAGIRGDLHGGDVYLVWLLDASISLYDDRQRLADKLMPFYHEMAGRNANTQSRLNSAVVAYGSIPVEVQSSTKQFNRMLDAIRGMPIDPSGKENVMSAVQFCLQKYKHKARGRMRIVIWTDESGDDNQLLEETIEQCRKFKAVVNVVGPSSVLGSDRGLQTYTDKSTGYKFLLPVVRGPDSCLPERLMLPYWFDTSSGAGTFAGGIVADGMPWYGGALRERLLSGVGPYALTRLSLETGGTFTLLDRPEDKSPFELDAMKRYFPDYDTADTILKKIRKSPLRLATWEAAMMTYREVNLAPPKTHFYLQRQSQYPFREVGPSYRPPAEFRRLLLDDLPKQIAHLTASAKLIEEALARITREKEMDVEYAKERSPRWKAWYDLTHGRLLAMSIRHREYLAACQWFITPGNLKPTTNHITFQATEKLRTADKSLEDRKTKALELLKRCQEANKGTPWELLAKWELEQGLGVEVVEHIVPVPGPSGPSPPPPKVVLPNL
jgi:hypothetical protein